MRHARLSPALAALGLALAAAAPAPALAAGTDTAPPPPTPAPAQWQHDWARGAVFYQVFVRSFADADGDGVGDLPGLLARLDYLNDGDPRTTTDLGVDALWLLPVFEAPSYHKYDVTDYEKVDREYGSNADLQRLCQEAHRRGMKVIVDLVLNHTSSSHPWFQESRSGPASAKRDWYVWRATDPGWTRPWSNDPVWHLDHGAYYYALFWGGMPDLNFRNPEVRAEARRLAKLWLDRGVDGFRLDAAKHLVESEDGKLENTPETHAFWREFAAYVRSVRPDAVLVGEIFSGIDEIAPYYGDVTRVAGGDELPMNFDFPIGGAIASAVRTGQAVNVFSTLREIQRTLPPGVIDAPFLTNHDQARVATLLEGDLPRLRAAAAILLTLPGAPFVYYGEELGLRSGGPGMGDRGGPGHNDQAKRTPMPWDGSAGGGFTRGRPWTPFSGGKETVNVAAEAGDPGSLLSRYRELIAARHRSAALSKGELTLLPPRGSVLAYLRRTAEETVLVLHNVGAAPAAVAARDLAGGPTPVALSGAPVPVLVDAGVVAGGEGPADWKVALPPYTTSIWRLTPGR